MFRLIKLAIYGIAAYTIYEFVQSFRGQAQQMLEQQPEQPGRDLEKAMNAPDEGRAGLLTGAGRGTTVTTEEAGGTSTPHVVGRGAAI